MRILHLINHCEHSNGNVHAAVDLACAQAAAGHEVRLASAGGYFEPLLAERGVRTIRLAHSMRKPREAVTALPALLAQIWSFRPEILHAHMMSSALVGGVAARLTCVPLVATVHNSFERHAKYMAIADAAVAVSHSDYDLLLEKGFAPKKLFTVWNGPLGSARYVEEAATSADPPRRKRVASLCGLHRRKGVAQIIEAFAQVAADFPDWGLLIAGEGPDLEMLRRLARDLGIAGVTEFAGKVSQPAAALRSAEIFVIASHAEPFGLAAVEARAAGCAVIGTRVGGIPEVLDFGRAGVLVEPKAPDQIADALRRLMGDAGARARLQAKALENLEVFTTTRQMNDYQAIYAQLRRRGGGWRLSSPRPRPTAEEPRVAPALPTDGRR